MVDAGAELVRRFDAEYKPVRAAFWLKDYDTGEWHLYLASDRINDGNTRQAYGAVGRILGPRPLLWLDSMQVKVRGTDIPLVRDVLDIQQKYPELLPIRLRQIRLGGEMYPEAFIYALPIPVAG